MIGEVLGEGFVVERPAGKGGMGRVFRARDRRTGTLVAVKVLESLDPDFETRFEREMRVLSDIAHPNVVRYVARGHSAEGKAYLVMEWLEGEDLAERFARHQPLSVTESLTIVRRAAEGLAAAHARGIVHRDVKPSNLYLVDRDPARLKVIDFGIARSEHASSVLTEPGALVGTVGYMAPEQALDPRRSDPRADVFSLGCVLFESLTGQALYRGVNPVAILSKVLSADAPPPSTLRPGLPRAVDELVLSMLERNVECRLADCSLVAEKVALLERITDIDPTAPTVYLREAPIESDAERKSTSILYVQGEESQPGAIESAVRLFGGSVTALGEQTWLVTLPERGAASDRAQRAAACALALREAGFGRIVVATSRAELHDGSDPSVIDRAAALLGTNSDVAVLLDDVTTAFLETTFDIERRGNHAALMGRRADPGGSRLLMGKPTPFVGREKDLAVLEAILGECLDEGVLRVALVTGPPGVGKSRLRQEFVNRVRQREELRVLIGRGELGTGSPLAVARQLVRAAAGASESHPPEQQAELLSEHLTRIAEPGQAQQLSEFLAEMLGLELAVAASPALRAARGDPQTMAELLPRALDEWLAAERRIAPVLVIIEDLQWADTASVELIMRAARNGRESRRFDGRAELSSPLRNHGLMVIALGRPEARYAFSQLLALDAAQHVRLGGIGARSAERLAHAVLGDRASSDAVSRIVELADGNAFYLEELCRAVAEGRGSLPESVLALAEARLDDLEPEARRVLRAASVLGNSFALDALCELIGAPESTRDWAIALVDRELFEDPSGTRTARPSELAFRHALLREAAYARLASDERRLLHTRAASWLEKQRSPDPVGVAGHWERAGEPERALRWIVTAAERAADAADFDTARRLSAQGLALGASGTDLGRLKLAGIALGQATEDGLSAALEALELVPNNSDQWFHALALASSSALILGRPESAALAQRLVERLDARLPATASVGLALDIACTLLWSVGQVELAEQMLAQFEQVAHDRDELDPMFELHLIAARVYVRAQCRDSLAGVISAARAATPIVAALRTASAYWHGGAALGLALAYVGAFARAETTLREALARSGNYAPHFVVVDLSHVLTRLGRYDEALELLRAYSSGAGVGPQLVEVATTYTLLHAGRAQEAASRADAVELQLPFPLLVSVKLAVRSQAALESGDADSALRHAEQGLFTATAGFRNALVLTWLALLRARSLYALGRLDDARVAIAGTRDRVLAVRDSIEDATLRAGYIDAFAENRTTLALAAEWLGA